MDRDDWDFPQGGTRRWSINFPLARGTKKVRRSDWSCSCKLQLRQSLRCSRTLIQAMSLHMVKGSAPWIPLWLGKHVIHHILDSTSPVSRRVPTLRDDPDGQRENLLAITMDQSRLQPTPSRLPNAQQSRRRFIVGSWLSISSSREM